MNATDEERRAKRAAQARARRARNPLPHREANRRYREANPDKVRDARQSPEAREVYRRWADVNRDKLNAQERARYAADLDLARTQVRQRAAKVRHGSDVAESFALMWEQQGGKCYLCGIYLVPSLVHVDHDHRCCPYGKSCSSCRRGLTCDKCNPLIGLADDDPALLRLIADNLEAKLAEVNARLAVKPEQMAIVPEGAR